MFIAPYKLWQYQNQTLAALQATLQKQLSLSVESAPVPSYNPDGSIAWFWQIKVQTGNQSVLRCYSHIEAFYQLTRAYKPIPTKMQNVLEPWPQQGNLLPWNRLSGNGFEQDLGRNSVAYIDFAMVRESTPGLVRIPSFDSQTDRPDYERFAIPSEKFEFEISVGSRTEAFERSSITLQILFDGGKESEIMEIMP